MRKCGRCGLECDEMLFGMHLAEHADEILPWLFLGHRRASRSHVELFERLDVKRILNMAGSEVVNYYEEKITYKRVLIRDALS